MVARSATLTRDGLTLRAYIFGNAEGPVVILVHGFPDTPHSWDGVLPHLVSAGYRVVVPWLRGYTSESVSRRARYDLLAVADDVAAWQQWSGAGPVHLVGHDWGAIAAMVTAKSEPQRWRSVSLLAAPPMGGRSLTFSALRQIPKQLVMSFYVWIMQAAGSAYLLGLGDARFVRWIWRRWSPGWQFTEEEFAPTREVFTDRHRAWAATRYYRSLFAVYRRHTRAFLRTVLVDYPAVPTLTLAGAEDGCMNVALHRALAAQSDGVIERRLPGCGHFLQAERPDAVAAELLTHLHRNNTIGATA